VSDVAAVEARLKDFLETLSPEARSMLARGAGNDPSPIADPLLARAIAAIGAPPDQSLSEAFFAPVATFLVDGQPAEPQTGRIPKSSAEAFWTWVSRDLLPEEVGAAGPGDAAAMRPRILAAARDAIDTAIHERDRLRLIGQLGGERQYRDAEAILNAFGHAGWVAAFVATLPQLIGREDIEGATAVTAAVTRLAAERPREIAWGLAGLLPRFESPALMALLVASLNGTAEAAPAAAGPYGAAIDLVLGELDIIAERLRAARGRNDDAGMVEALSVFAAVARDAEAALDIAGSQRWGARLARLKTTVSAQITEAIGLTPGLTRRILSLRGQSAAHDPAIAEDAERGLRLVVAATRGRDSLAVNQLLQSVRRELDQSFEVLLPPLFDSLRRGHGQERVNLLGRVDAAIRLAAVYLGEDFAAALRRSRQAALIPTRAASSR
jgi:hypothetical protein